MQSLRETDDSASLDTRILENHPWTTPADDPFDAFRGVFLATVLGVPAWAGALLLYLWFQQ